MKLGRIIVEPGKPLRFEVEAETESSIKPEQKSVAQIAKSLSSYLKAAHGLLQGKYSAFANIAPRHLRTPCNLTVIGCSEGVLVRYDAGSQEEPEIHAGIAKASLAELSLGLSEHMIHIVDDLEHPPAPDTNGPAISMMMGNYSTGETRLLFTFHPMLCAVRQLPADFKTPAPPARPACLISVQSEFDIQLQGDLLPVDPALTAGVDQQHFIAHSSIQLPVGWQVIEIYPLLSDEHWKVEYAPLWAELDILAWVAQRNLQTEQLNALDPRGDTRRKYAVILEEFQHLLDGPEEPAHQFLKQHPELISPTCERSWSKLRFGDTISDFVFRESYNDYELVELEAPIRPLFRKDGQQREELTHAINQIADWVSYIEDNKKLVESDLGLIGISTSPRTLVVIGRGDSLTEENRRKVVTLQNQYSKLRILTYDDILANARSNLERILGPLSITGENSRLYFF